MKPAWQSKTVWVSALMAIAPLIPGIGPLIQNNVEAAGAIVGAVFSLLRLISNDRIMLVPKE